MKKGTIILIVTILLSSALYAYSFLDRISFYWNLFGEALMFWSAVLIIIGIVKHRKKWFFIFSIVLLFLGLLINKFSHIPKEDEVVLYKGSVPYVTYYSKCSLRVV